MVIFLGIVGELITVIGSVAITIHFIIDSVLEIPNNGYKLDKDLLDEKKAKEKTQKPNSTKMALTTMLLLAPGINLIYTSIKGVKLKKGIMKDPEIKKCLIPMPEPEKEKYAHLTSKFLKLKWATFTDYKLTSLCYEKLMPLNYTIDEVKRLNEATTYSYRIGISNGKNIAIIGIPNPNGVIKRIRSKEDNYNTIHMYENITEQEAKDLTFTVYPFTMYKETQSEVEKVIQKIKQDRADQAVKASLEERKASKELQSQNVLEQNYSAIIAEETLIEEPEEEADVAYRRALFLRDNRL